jgi:hypothetical protein
MSGVIYQFGTTTLPHHAPRWNVSTPARKQVTRTLGGIYDPNRSDAAGLDLPYNVTVSALALEESASALGATLDAYRALLGKRDRLWLDPYDTSQTNRWCWARLVDINYTGAYNNRIWQPVDLVFQCLSGWNGRSYGGSWALDSGQYFDNGLWFDSTDQTIFDTLSTTITVPNAGNRACHNAGLTLTAGLASMTSVRVVGYWTDWTWTGTLPTGSQLVIDSGSKTVLLNGQPDYAGFAINANHASPHWLVLEPGDNTVTLTITRSAPMSVGAQFTYSDAWM